MRVINSLAHTTAKPAIGKKKTKSKFEVDGKTFCIVINGDSRYESRTLGIDTQRIAEEESGYAVKSDPLEADPRKPHIGTCAAQSSRSSCLSVRVL